MAIVQRAENQPLVSAQKILPARSSAAANTSADAATVERTDIRSNGAKNASGVGMDISQTNQEYVLTMIPTTTLLPNARIGDKAKVYFVDDANGGAVVGYNEYIYTGTGSTYNTTPTWRPVLGTT